MQTEILGTQRLEIAMQYYYQILEQITTGTDSSLILFFVIVAAMLLPLYVLTLRERKNSRKHELEMKAELKKYESEKHAKYIEREREIINVVKENTAVISALHEAIKTLVSTGDAQSKDIKLSIARVHERIDNAYERIDRGTSISAEILAFLKNHNHKYGKTP